MTKISVPIAIETVYPENAEQIANDMVSCHVSRVFFCLFPHIHSDKLQETLQRFAQIKPYFKKRNLEVGIWIDSFGHGADLGRDKDLSNKTKYTLQTGFYGERKANTICPLDPRFRTDFGEYIEQCASVHPDIIMLDDDFRLSVRSYGIGCACRLHRKAFAKKVGYVPKIMLPSKLFSGKENKYRSAWLKVQGESLIRFALEARKSVDKVDETIRLGCCMCMDTWDLSGTDGYALATAFAGKTKPFLRLIGAPYWQKKSKWGRVGDVVEYSRMQCAWMKSHPDVEIFSEGDVFPRPRYIVPSSWLELYDTALRMTGCPGILKYMVDYNHPYGYEQGYIKNHLQEEPFRREIDEIFADKTPVGIRIEESFHKIEKADLPQKLPMPWMKNLPTLLQKTLQPFVTPIARISFMQDYFFGRMQHLLCALSLPVVYEGEGICTAVFGENAKHIDISSSSNGYILDAVAAKILTERGMDVGFVGSKHLFSDKEYYGEGEKEKELFGAYYQTLFCKEGAKAMSFFDEEKNKKASYLYENENGQRFYVLGMDAYQMPMIGDDNYLYNYYRQEQLFRAVEWVSRKKLPVACYKNPHLHFYVAESSEERVIGICNYYFDPVYDCSVQTDEDFADAKFIRCEGTYSERTISIKYISPYSAVVVRLIR